MEIDNFQEPTDQFNDEAAMAKADLYKLGKYSVKLIKQIHDGQDLEAWIQAKITKAADYIASVYHYMEYEMKVSEYGDKLENADMYEEHLKDKLKNKLMEAKANLKKVAKKESMKNKEKMCKEDCSTCQEDCDQKQLKEGPYLGTKYTDIDHPKYGKLELINLGSFMMIVGEPGSDFQDIKGDQKMVQSAWRKILNDVHKHKMKQSGWSSIVSDESVQTEAATKPSAGISKKQKSAVVSKAKKGEDLGKPGKGFKEVEKSAKKSGASNPTAVAASAMWKQQAKKAKKG